MKSHVFTTKSEMALYNSKNIKQFFWIIKEFSKSLVRTYNFSKFFHYPNDKTHGAEVERIHFP
jgi:hypothetical protein